MPLWAHRRIRRRTNSPPDSFFPQAAGFLPFFSYLCRQTKKRDYGIRRYRVQNNARDERHFGPRRMAAPGCGLRDERRFIHPQDLRDVLQQTRRRGPAARRGDLHRFGEHRVARIQRPLVYRHPGLAHPAQAGARTDTDAGHAPDCRGARLCIGPGCRGRRPAVLNSGTAAATGPR